MDIVERLRTDFGREGDADLKEAADEIERLQLREETLSGIIDGMTARFIEAQGAVEEIERLRQKHKDMVSKLKWVVNEYNKLLNDHNELLKETTGGE